MKTINKIGIILLLVTILIGPFLFFCRVRGRGGKRFRGWWRFALFLVGLFRCPRSHHFHGLRLEGEEQRVSSQKERHCLLPLYPRFPPDWL